MSLVKTCLFLFVLVLAVLGVEGKKGDMTAYMKRTGAKFLTETAQRPEVFTLKSGMLVEVINIPY